MSPHSLITVFSQPEWKRISPLCSPFQADQPPVKCHLHAMRPITDGQYRRANVSEASPLNYSPFRNLCTSPSPKLAPQGHPPPLLPPVTPPPLAGSSSLAYLYRGKYFTLYELLSAGPVLSNVEIERLFTALLGRMRRKPGAAHLSDRLSQAIDNLQ